MINRYKIISLPKDDIGDKNTIVKSDLYRMELSTDKYYTRIRFGKFINFRLNESGVKALDSYFQSLEPYTSGITSYGVSSDYATINIRREFKQSVIDKFTEIITNEKYVEIKIKVVGG